MYIEVMSKQAQWKRQAFLAGFLDGFACAGQFGARVRKPVVVRLPSGGELSPLEMVRRKAARLCLENRVQGAR